MDPQTEHAENAKPAKCKECERLLASPPVCDFCKALNPIPAMTDYFSMLDLPRRYDVDEAQMHRKFLELNRHAHPDYHAEESPDDQLVALTVSATLNDAYRTLKDPYLRATYLLELLGGKSSADDKSVPDRFLGQTMMMQEEIADARAAGNAGELQRLQGVLVTQQTALMNRVAALFADYPQAVACEAVRKDLLGEIRKQLNAVSYVKKLISQLG